MWKEIVLREEKKLLRIVERARQSLFRNEQNQIMRKKIKELSSEQSIVEGV